MAGPGFADYPSHLGVIRQIALRTADAGAAVIRHLGLGEGHLRAGSHVLPLTDRTRITLVALGKAAPAMSRAAAEILGGRLVEGVAAVPKADPGTPPQRVAFIPAGHPLPDEGSLKAGRAVAAALAKTGRDDIVLVLVSGGGSAMLELPVPRVDLADLRALNMLLLCSGAPIQAMNIVRKALSQIKAGGLARLAAPARVVALILSDVVGDRLSAIASGPTVLYRVRPADAIEVLKGYDLWARAPDNVRRALSEAATTTPSVPRPRNLLIGSNRQVLEAVARQAADLGFVPRPVTARMQGEAREVGRRFAARLAQLAAKRRPTRRAAQPTCLLMGGETTVAVRGPGMGGRNQELALAAALALNGVERVALMAMGTDGVDGPTDAAGAQIDGRTVARARNLGLDPQKALEENDSYPLLDAVGALIRTGPTGTNLNDIAVGLVYP